MKTEGCLGIGKGAAASSQTRGIWEQVIFQSSPEHGCGNFWDFCSDSFCDPQLCSGPLSSAVCWQHFLQGTICILLKHQTQNQCLACFTVIPNLVTRKETEIQKTELELCVLIDLFFCISPGWLSDIRADCLLFLFRVTLWPFAQTRRAPSSSVLNAD